MDSPSTQGTTTTAEWQNQVAFQCQVYSVPYIEEPTPPTIQLVNESGPSLDSS